jgi:hypothetical protein
MNGELKALLDGPQASVGTSDEATPSLTAAAEDGGEADTEAHDAHQARGSGQPIVQTTLRSVSTR